jgi:hypothetical protein
MPGEAIQAFTKGREVVGGRPMARSALATAAAITGVPGSPIPLGGFDDGTM